MVKGTGNSKKEGTVKSLKKCGFFITGTDTDIGKTYVSRYLADAFSNYITVTYFKPVQTGCASDREGGLTAPDFDYVMRGKAIQTSSYENHVPYRFKSACSPHLAASSEGTNISIEFILRCLESVTRERTLVLVEGAGGLFVPLDESKFMLDLMKTLNYPVILVTPPRLGTLNHTFLSLSVLKNAHIPLAGVIFNNPTDMAEDYIYTDNLKTIRKYVDPVSFLEVKYSTPPDLTTEEFCHEIAREHF